MSGQRVVVLPGGLSHERDVSLRSGRRVVEALRRAGAEAEVRDVDAGLMNWLREQRPDSVLPMLHGEAGEDGALREILELADVAYVGSGPQSARVAFDKTIAKQVVSRAGVRTPPSVALPADTFREVGAAAVMKAVVERLGLPLFVKPARGGSALGCAKVETAADLPGAMVHAFSYSPVALIERCIIGTEVAVPVFERDGTAVAYPGVEIIPDGGVYDYSARYTAGSTEFVVPAEVGADVARLCAEVAVAAHQALGLRDLSRSDLMIDAEGRVWFLEVNVAPGMTETSLVPLSVEAAGEDLGDVLAGLAGVARGRRSRE